MRVLILSLLLSVTVAAADDAGTTPSSPAARRIEMAQAMVQKQPDRFQAYNDLALALIGRARETADPSYYEQAETAVARSLKLQPHNFEGEQAHVALLLAEHRYDQALEEAKDLNQKTPDSVAVWGQVAEAEEALGDYDNAARAAQWMLNLRPGNVPGLLRAAALREDWGDVEGAADLLNKALVETPAFETEQTAWILTSLARLNRVSGKLDAADSLLKTALASFPEYYASLEELSSLRAAQHRDGEGIAVLQKRNNSFPTPQSLYLLATALDRAGQAQGAHAAFANFERTARERIDRPDNANRELILYYADRGRQPAEALRIARIETGRRHDVRTLDAYAWALHSCGQDTEARAQIDKALAVGTRDAELLSHATAIGAPLGDKDAASRLLKQALDPNQECAAAGCDPVAAARPANPGVLH